MTYKNLLLLLTLIIGICLITPISAVEHASNKEEPERLSTVYIILISVILSLIFGVIIGLIVYYYYKQPPPSLLNIPEPNKVPFSLNKKTF